eukprot:scaffold10944_cov43-Cyclotella_meneghiniana.AAC.1
MEGRNVKWGECTEEREWNAATVIDTDEYDEYDSHSCRDGLHRERFLDIEDKSTEGQLCAAYTSLGKDICGCVHRIGSGVIGKGGGFVEGGWETLVTAFNDVLPQHTSAYKGAKSSNNKHRMKHFGDSLKRLHHVMFRYHDVKTKDASKAWKHLQKGNEYKMSVLPPFDKRFEPIRATAHSNGETDFYKASGSTLLERILDAHPLLVGAGEDSVFNGSLDYILNEIVAAKAGDLSILHRKVKKLADDVVIDMIKRWEIINDNTRSSDTNEDDDSDEEERDT